MDRKILKIGYIVLLTAIIVCVIMIAVQDIRMGLHSTMEKVFVAPSHLADPEGTPAEIKQ